MLRRWQLFANDNGGATLIHGNVTPSADRSAFNIQIDPSDDLIRDQE